MVETARRKGMPIVEIETPEAFTEEPEQKFDVMFPICREYQISNIFDTPLCLRKELLSKIGFTYFPVSNKKGSKRPTVRSFAKDNPKGAYIAIVAKHVVAIVDGKYYDTWDSGEYSLYGYFSKEEVK